MKVLLDCTDVFEALTSARDATRDEEALHEHLEYCPECRQLAGEIEPGVDLFGDVLHTDGFERLPAASFASGILARLEAEQRAILVESHKRSFLSLTPHAWSQLGAAAAILLALGGLFWAASPGEPAPRHELAVLPAFASPLVRATHPEGHGWLHLASLQLPERCLSPAAASQDGAAMFRCCTRCHQTGDTLPAVRLVAFSQQSCLACHKS